MRISDWSSDVCSSDLREGGAVLDVVLLEERGRLDDSVALGHPELEADPVGVVDADLERQRRVEQAEIVGPTGGGFGIGLALLDRFGRGIVAGAARGDHGADPDGPPADAQPVAPLVSRPALPRRAADG